MIILNRSLKVTLYKNCNKIKKKLPKSLICISNTYLHFSSINQKKSNSFNTSFKSTSNFDFVLVKDDFEKVIKSFRYKANEILLGKLNVKIFENLVVKTVNGNQNFKNLCQVSIKGKNIIITLFDSKNSKCIINTILNLNQNYTVQIDPNNEYIIKLIIPPVSTENKIERAKFLKDFYELTKSSSSKTKFSLSGIRSEFKNSFFKIVNKTKLSDDQKMILDKFEIIHKDYVKILTEIYKETEQKILM